MPYSGRPKKFKPLIIKGFVNYHGRTINSDINYRLGDPMYVLRGIIIYKFIIAPYPLNDVFLSFFGFVAHNAILRIFSILGFNTLGRVWLRLN